MVLTTVQCQDLQDQDGDAVRGRETLPLVMRIAYTLDHRYTDMLLVCVCPFVWSLPLLGCVPMTSLGLIVASRFLIFRDVATRE